MTPVAARSAAVICAWLGWLISRKRNSFVPFVPRIRPAALPCRAAAARSGCSSGCRACACSDRRRRSRPTRVRVEDTERWDQARHRSALRARNRAGPDARIRRARDRRRSSRARGRGKYPARRHRRTFPSRRGPRSCPCRSRRRRKQRAEQNCCSPCHRAGRSATLSPLAPRRRIEAVEQVVLLADHAEVVPAHTEFNVRRGVQRKLSWMIEAVAVFGTCGAGVLPAGIWLPPSGGRQPCEEIGLSGRRSSSLPRKVLSRTCWMVVRRNSYPNFTSCLPDLPRVVVDEVPVGVDAIARTPIGRADLRETCQR